jgi:hypothetical protein
MLEAWARRAHWAGHTVQGSDVSATTHQIPELTWRDSRWEERVYWQCGLRNGRGCHNTPNP